ncbi:hypothetical protein [Brunnivagina elsteri]|uniref:Filamentous hemagglutinin n=1 Tax=Brunnivagina elsteri CCALA 953 TaxID=987040 RepID=A0A2A2TMH6_9CYAN|nr:hypothetical protein [Calothrix elsteri]PAX59635.1 hypothetical protein CK510_06125 [Calothrix elsteri CCALA 953]
MKLKLLALSAFTVSAMSTVIPALTPSASAVCINTRVGVQVSVHGKGSTANQNQNATQSASDDCFNNQSSVTGVQVHTGKGSVNQNMNSNQRLSGGHNPTGVRFKPINNNVEVKVNVPAFPTFPK